MSGVDLKQINRNDQVIMGATILAFIFSFTPYWGVTYPKEIARLNWSTSAWTGFAVVGLLLVLLAGGIVAARVFGNAVLPKLPVGPNLLVAAISAIGTLLVILRGFTYPHASYAGASLGVRWGGYILMILCVAQVVGAVRAFTASGEALTWDSSALNRPAAQAPGQPGAPAAYPPPAGYQASTSYQPPTQQQSGAPDQNQPSA